MLHNENSCRQHQQNTSFIFPFIRTIKSTLPLTIFTCDVSLSPVSHFKPIFTPLIIEQGRERVYLKECVKVCITLYLGDEKVSECVLEVC